MEAQMDNATGAMAGAHKRLAGKYLTFNLAEEEYGLQILRVREIIGMMDVRPIPRTPDFVLGVVNLRGKVIPVVDLRTKFGLGFREADERTCIIVVEVLQSDSHILMGIVVDNVNEVSEVREEDMEETPSFGVAVDTDFILGMAKVNNGVKILLDIDKVLTSGEIESLDAF